MSDRRVDDFLTGGEFGHAKRAMAHDRAAVPAEAAPPAAGAPLPGAALELHVCMGLNSCQGHDAPGTAPMAGMGQCATVAHVCHGSNDCRGQGGCGYAGSDAEQAKPGNQSCKWNGSCASPINQTRVSSAGPNKGRSVWQLARRIFEARMYDAQVPFGPAPGQGWPDDLVPSYESPPPTCPPPA